MTSLLGLLDLGASAYGAQKSGVAVAGRNIGNAGTAGYSRERVDLRALPGVPIVGGVRSGDPTRIASALVAGRERAAAGSLGHASSLSSALLDLESRVAGDGNVGTAMAEFFGAWQALSSSPSDPALRLEAVGRARNLAVAFRDTAGDIQRSREDANARIGTLAGEASSLAAQIASANEALTIRADPTLEDARDEAARQLASLTGGEARIDGDGHMRFVLSGGEVLVDGTRAARLETTPDAANSGFHRLVAVDGAVRHDVTAQIDAGEIGGELVFRDVESVATAASLDRLAFDFVGAVNGVHATNAGLDGTTGTNLFDPPGGSAAGAAASLRLDASVAADPNLLAVADAGAPAGDGTGANEMLALRDATIAGNGTRSAVDEAFGLLAQLGSTAAAAEQNHGLEMHRADLAAALRDSVSGVSIEEEMTKMAAFQHAAQAATQFITTVDEMLGDLLGTLR